MAANKFQALVRERSEERMKKQQQQLPQVHATEGSVDEETKEEGRKGGRGRTIGEEE